MQISRIPLNYLGATVIFSEKRVGCLPGKERYSKRFQRRERCEIQSSVVALFS